VSGLFELLLNEVGSLVAKLGFPGVGLLVAARASGRGWDVFVVIGGE